MYGRLLKFESSIAVPQNPRSPVTDLKKCVERAKKALESKPESFFKNGDTYFHAFGTIIGPKCLTTEFGKGSGVTTPVCSPGMICRAYSPRQIQFVWQMFLWFASWLGSQLASRLIALGNQVHDHRRVISDQQICSQRSLQCEYHDC